MLRVNVEKVDEEGNVTEPKVYDDSKKINFRFHKTNPLEKEEFEVKSVEDSDQYFFFSHVPADDIQELISIQSRIYPIVKIYET